LPLSAGIRSSATYLRELAGDESPAREYPAADISARPSRPAGHDVRSHARTGIGCFDAAGSGVVCRCTRELARRVTCPLQLPRRPTLTSPCSPTTAAGTLRTKLEPLPGGDLIGAPLARQRSGLCSIDCVYGRGRFYNLRPRRHRDRLRGQHLDAPRLIRRRGALLLLVRSPREATVPHRELSGLRLG
jgi:hypothetical protein